MGLKRCKKRYDAVCDYMKDPYAQWIKENERGQAGNTAVPFVVISLEDFWANMLSSWDEWSDDWFALTLLKGEVRFPKGETKKAFQDASTGLVYADEDMFDPVAKKRYGAWFKPDYSPETLLSFFYFGSVLFLRGSLVKAAMQSYNPAYDYKDATARQMLYDFVLYYVQFLESKACRIQHIPQVLFHAEYKGYVPEETKRAEVVNEEAYFGYEPEYGVAKLAYAERNDCEICFESCNKYKKQYHILNYKIKGTLPKVSVVIPSKDNPEVLATCIKSFAEKTSYKNYELILVDNGSNEQNKSIIKQLCERYHVAYYYEPMTFNFSKMCNLGVSKASGEFILLLNDDMEIVQPDWLTKMVGQAMQEGVGAVGAKLLYPNSDLIQHVGITNLWVGPAHKLLKEHDDAQDYYYGRNMLTYDMIGVTAACLLISREIYDEVGGFCEDVAVSYNDVDFCFAVYEKGYRNVIRNDVVLYHHESLSRGDDALSDEKWNRLLREKDIVYGRHPALQGVDPYYGPNLAGFKHKYFCSFQYEFEKRDYYSRMSPYKRTIPEVWYNNSVMLTVEHAKLERKLDLHTEEDVLLIEGWAYVLGMDNCRYKRSIILTDEKDNRFEVQLVERYRPDVVDILPEQTNVALSGFQCRIKRSQLAAGTYQIALLYRDLCSRQRLYQVSEKPLIVKGE